PVVELGLGEGLAAIRGKSKIGGEVTPQVFAFADDVALGVEYLPAVYPCLRLLDIFSAVSGLGLNKDKSCVVCTLGPDSYPHVLDLIRAGPWPDLPLKPAAVHLGIALGREVTLGDIFAKPYEKALKRLSDQRNIIRPLSLANRILYVNTFITSIF